MAITQDAINDALERLSSLGFAMENSFFEHGPMLAEGISTLGCNEDVAGWIEIYKQKHQHAPLPPRKQPTDGSNETKWRSALGDHSRCPKWGMKSRSPGEAERPVRISKTSIASD
jgi:hypothetical protein